MAAIFGEFRARLILSIGGPLAYSPGMREKGELGRGAFAVGGVAAEPTLNRLRAGASSVSVEPKVMDLLVVLASEPGTVFTRASLIDAVWGVSFGGDESLTRAVSSLRRAFGELAPGAPFLETIPKRGYRLVARVETGADAVAPDSGPIGAARGRPRAPSIRRIAYYSAAAAAAGLAFVLIAVRSLTSHAVRYDEVAVGEIAPIAGDPRSEKAAAALRASLLRELSLGGVESVSASNARDAGITLVGAFAPSGAGSAVNIRAEDAVTGQVLWSRQFELGDRPQREVRHYVPWRIADVVSCGLVGNRTIEPLKDPKLVGFFMKGCDGFRTGGGFEPLLEFTRKALVYAPESLTAQVRNAIAAAWTAGGAQSAADREDLLNVARRRAEALVKSHPELGQAYYAHGVADWIAMDWISAEENLRKALKLDPAYPYTYNALSNVVRRTGRIREAVDLERRAIVADHFSLVQPMTLALLLADQGDLPGARSQAQSITMIDARMACDTNFQIDFWWGDESAALADLASECVRSQYAPRQLACYKAFLEAKRSKTGRRDALDRCAGVDGFNAIRFAVALGFVDDAMRMELARDIKRYETPGMFYAGMKPFRRDARFMKVAARYGLTAAWLQSDTWPDFCGEEELPYDCREAAQAAQKAVMAAN